MAKGIYRRLDAIKRECRIDKHTHHVLVLIEAGAYYDELTDEEKNAYCKYRECDRDALETLNEYVLGNLHFQIERKPKPPTEAEFRENVREVEAIMAGFVAEYNTPERKQSGGYLI